jgi:hypothetical protein
MGSHALYPASICISDISKPTNPVPMTILFVLSTGEKKCREEKRREEKRQCRVQ